MLFKKFLLISILIILIFSFGALGFALPTRIPLPEIVTPRLLPARLPSLVDQSTRVGHGLSTVKKISVGAGKVILSPYVVGAVFGYGLSEFFTWDTDCPVPILINPDDPNHNIDLYDDDYHLFKMITEERTFSVFKPNQKCSLDEERSAVFAYKMGDGNIMNLFVITFLSRDKLAESNSAWFDSRKRYKIRITDLLTNDQKTSTITSFVRVNENYLSGPEVVFDYMLGGRSVFGGHLSDKVRFIEFELYYNKRMLEDKLNNFLNSLEEADLPKDQEVFEIEIKDGQSLEYYLKMSNLQIITPNSRVVRKRN